MNFIFESWKFISRVSLVISLKDKTKFSSVLRFELVIRIDRQKRLKWDNFLLLSPKADKIRVYFCYQHLWFRNCLSCFLCPLLFFCFKIFLLIRWEFNERWRKSLLQVHHLNMLPSFPCRTFNTHSPDSALITDTLISHKSFYIALWLANEILLLA